MINYFAIKNTKDNKYFFGRSTITMQHKPIFGNELQDAELFKRSALAQVQINWLKLAGFQDLEIVGIKLIEA